MLLCLPEGNMDLFLQGLFAQFERNLSRNIILRQPANRFAVSGRLLFTYTLLSTGRIRNGSPRARGGIRPFLFTAPAKNTG